MSAPFGPRTGWRVKILDKPGERRVVVTAPSGTSTWPLLPMMCPKAIEQMIADGEIEGAKALAAGWLAVLGRQYQVRGLELPPELQAPASAASGGSSP